MNLKSSTRPRRTGTHNKHHHYHLLSSSSSAHTSSIFINKKNQNILFGFILIFVISSFFSYYNNNNNGNNFLVSGQSIMSSSVSTATDADADDFYHELVVFTVTYYTSPNELRCKQTYDTLTALIKNNIPVVVVDDSPIESGVYEYLSSIENNILQQQQKQQQQKSPKQLLYVTRQKQKGGLKGVALREAAKYAATSIPNVNVDKTWLCWQEAEKTDMANHWKYVINESKKIQSDITVPYRIQQSFHNTYPIEQYHSETYGNLYLDAVAHEYYNKNVNNNNNNVDNSNNIIYNPNILPKHIDWHFGPLAFKCKYVDIWTNYNGQMYDAQLVPIIIGLKHNKLKLSSISINFISSIQMKKQEEGNISFIEKRLKQLSTLDPIIKDIWMK